MQNIIWIWCHMCAFHYYLYNEVNPLYTMQVKIHKLAYYVTLIMYILICFPSCIVHTFLPPFLGKFACHGPYVICSNIYYLYNLHYIISMKTSLYLHLDWQIYFAKRYFFIVFHILFILSYTI